MSHLTLASLLLLASAASARVEAPSPRIAGGRYSNALKAAWTPDPAAVVHELALSRVETFPPRYATLREWDFSSLTNTAGVTRNLSALGASGAFGDVGGTNLCLHAYAGGHLQVGKNKAVGVMRLPLSAAEARTVLLTLFRHGPDKDGTVPVGCLGEGGETVVLARPYLTLTPTVFDVSLPDATRTLLVQSKTTRRIRVSDVKLVTDYVAAHATTNEVATRRTQACACTVTDLRPGEYLWRIRSYDREGNVSPWSAYQTVILDPKADRYPKGLRLRLR